MSSPATRIPAETAPKPLGSAGAEQHSAARSQAGWWWLIGLAIVGGAGWQYRQEIAHAMPAWLKGRAEAKAPPVRATPVKTALVERQDIPLYLDGLGTVTALKTVTVRSRVAGELTAIEFDEGEMVEEGNLLAEIDPRPFEVQKAQAAGQMARDAATLRGARQSLARLKQLFDMKIATAQQIDDQEAIVQQLEGVIQADQAMIDQAELQLTYCSITAPISGRIGLRMTDKGNIVQANDPRGIAMITQLQPISLVFTLPQDDIGRVQERLAADGELTVNAYDRSLRKKLAAGKLIAIDNQVDPTNGTVRLKAEFENTDGLLFPNQFVNVRLLVETQAGALVIPTAAVQRGPNGPFVYVVKDDDTVDLRPVIPGAAEAGRTAIASGVNVGECVVTAGLDRLRPGAPVTYEKDEKPAEPRPTPPAQRADMPIGKSPETEPRTNGKSAAD